MKSLFQLLFISFLFNHAVSVASEQPCDEETLKIVADFLKLRNFHLYDGQTGIVVSQACKQSPLNTSITLASIAYQRPDTATQLSSGEGKKVIVAVVDRTKQQLVSRYQADIEEDALTEFGENSFKIDTARYQLADNVRAFGVRFQSNARGPSCAERLWEDELILFVPNGEKLEPVFGMPMAVYQAIKGSMGGCSNEETISDNVGLTLSVKKSSHHGYADLLLTANIERYSAEKSVSEHRSEHFLMQFDGQRYIANQKSKPWWVFDKAVLIK